jgi:acetyltransferase-like isoleucine patch superfamily enzyme
MNFIKKYLEKWFTSFIGFKKNNFHPLVWIVGNPEIGQGVYIGGISEINAKGSKVIIGDYCDIASFVTINSADSHKLSIGLISVIEREDIIIGNNVFIGSHSVIKGGAEIGHHSVVAAGTIVSKCKIPPYSLVIGNPAVIKEGYYKDMLNQNDST